MPLRPLSNRGLHHRLSSGCHQARRVPLAVSLPPIARACFQPQCRQVRAIQIQQPRTTGDLRAARFVLESGAAVHQPADFLTAAYLGSQPTVKCSHSRAVRGHQVAGFCSLAPCAPSGSGDAASLHKSEHSTAHLRIGVAEAVEPLQLALACNTPNWCWRRALGSAVRGAPQQRNALPVWDSEAFDCNGDSPMCETQGSRKPANSCAFNGWGAPVNKKFAHAWPSKPPKKRDPLKETPGVRMPRRSAPWRHSVPPPGTGRQPRVRHGSKTGST
jgi:hypothetical protein